MKKRFRFLLSFGDPGLLVILGICLLAVWPFISRHSLPHFTDAELHVFRLAELSRVIRDGVLYPRWAPNFYFGYGYPIFNYYAPLTYYIGLLFDFLPLVGPVFAVKAVFVLGTFAAGFGMYGYVRNGWGKAAGIVAATAYVYAPYILFIDPYARGDMAEAFSFGVFPFALWALDNLLRHPSKWNWILSVTFIAAIILSHNLMALVLFGLLLGWVIWHTLFYRNQGPSNISGVPAQLLIRFRMPLALLLGIGVSAFFWLVVGLERDAVNLASLVGQGGHFDYRNHFLNLSILLGPVSLIDWGASEPEYQFNLGITQWLLGLSGIILVTIDKAENRVTAGYFGAVAILLGFLMIPLSDFLWDTIPFMPYLQFPWRLLGAEAAMLAILAGVTTSFLVKRLNEVRSGWVTVILMLALIVPSLPLLEIPPWPTEFGPTTPGRVLTEELAGRWLGTTSTADFLPKRVDILPKPRSNMLDDIFKGRPIDRVNRASLPDGTAVTSVERSLLHTQFQVESQQDFMLRLFLFDFPGWKATIDGVPVEVEVGRPEGFIVIPVTAGSHLVDLKFGQTLSRNFATVVSIASVVLTVVIGFYLPIWPAKPNDNELNEDIQGKQSRTINFWPVLISLAFVFFLTVFIIQPGGWLRNESTGNQVLPADQETAANYGQQFMLVGYDLPKSGVHPGDTISMTAYWKAIADIDINYQVFVHLLDDNDNLVAQSDKLNPGNFPTKLWTGDKYVRDEHTIQLPTSLPRGEYKWSLGLWVASEGWRLPLLDDQGNQIGDSFILPERLKVD